MPSNKNSEPDALSSEDNPQAGADVPQQQQVIDGEVAVRRCGRVALIGRPNVGKSTLLNHLLGTKLSITSRRPQTTRHSLLGVHTKAHDQILFIDTPGINGRRSKGLNRYMNRVARNSIREADVLVMLVERNAWRSSDEQIHRSLGETCCPVILAMNKIDRMSNRTRLLPFIAEVSKKRDFEALVPISALRGDGIEDLFTVIRNKLPQGPHVYPTDQLTNRSEAFLATEIIREKIMRQLGDEIPYQVTVQIEYFSYQKDQILHIHALIITGRAGQKAIIIGKAGERLRTIGQSAREDLEKLFASQVMLNLWVKVRSGWSENDQTIKSFGYI